MFLWQNTQLLEIDTSLPQQLNYGGMGSRNPQTWHWGQQGSFYQQAGNKKDAEKQSSWIQDFKSHLLATLKPRQEGNRSWKTKPCQRPNEDAHTVLLQDFTAPGWYLKWEARSPTRGNFSELIFIMEKFLKDKGSMPLKTKMWFWSEW